jgi:hypothetical protein
MVAMNLCYKPQYHRRGEHYKVECEMRKIDTLSKQEGKHPVGFASASRVGGQVSLGDIHADYIAVYEDAKREERTITMGLVHGSYFHGHKPGCTRPTCPRDKHQLDEMKRRVKSHEKKMQSAREFAEDPIVWNMHAVPFSRPSGISLAEMLPGRYCRNVPQLVEHYDCDAPNHNFMKAGYKGQREDQLIEDLWDLAGNKNSLPYDAVMNRLLVWEGNDLAVNTGRGPQEQAILACIGGELRADAKCPAFGFCLQKSTVIDLMSREIKAFMTANGISPPDNSKLIGAHSFKDSYCIHSSQLRHLDRTFGFKVAPFVTHVAVFKSDNFLGGIINTSLKVKAEIKKMLHEAGPEMSSEERTTLTLRAESKKLEMNATYGYSLMGSQLSRYTSSTVRRLGGKINKRMNRRWKRNRIIKRVFPLAGADEWGGTGQLAVVTYAPRHDLGLVPPLPCQSVGVAILASSKVLYLERLQWVLRLASPELVELVYIDTDSAILNMVHEDFDDNIAPHCRDEYERTRASHFDPSSAPGGMLVEEGRGARLQVHAEKSYALWQRDPKRKGGQYFAKGSKSAASK